MKNSILLFPLVLLGLMILAGCREAAEDRDKPTITLEVIQPDRGLSLAYTLPVGEESEQGALAHRSELLSRFNEVAMYAALAEAAGGEVRDKVEIERIEAVDTEYRISVPAVLGATDEDSFLWPESEGECLDMVVTKTFTLHSAVVVPVQTLPDDEKLAIEAALAPLHLYYLCGSVGGETRVVAWLIGEDDAALRKAAMEIIIADGRLGAIMGLKNLRRAS